VRDQKGNQREMAFLITEGLLVFPAASEAFFIPTTVVIMRLYTDIIDRKREKGQFQKIHNQTPSDSALVGPAPACLPSVISFR
jgi:hypothetical protein